MSAMETSAPPASPGSRMPTTPPSLAASLWRSRSLIVGCAVIAAVAALVASLFAERRYEARVSVLAEPRKESNPLQLEIRSQQERQGFLETQKELLVSRAVVAEAVSELQGKPVGEVTPAEIEHFLKNVRVTSRSGLGRNLFSGSGIGDSGTFFVMVNADDPKDAAHAANVLVEKYLEISRRLRAQLAQGALTVLEGASEESSRRTVEAQRIMAQLEAQAGDLLPNLLDADKPTLPVFPELQRLRTEYLVELAKVEQQRSRVELMAGALETSGEAVLPNDLVTQNSAIGQLKAKLADLRVEAVKHAPFYLDSAREVTSLQEQIKLVEHLLHDEARRVLAGERQNLASIERAQESRSRWLEEYRDRVTSLSLMNSDYSEAKRLYDGLASAQQTQVEGLASAQVAAADRSAQAGNIVVLDRAVPDPRPISPSPGRNVTLAGLLGALAGLLVALLRMPATIPTAGGRRTTD